MKIVVCFKILPDYEEISPEEWSLPEEPDVRFVKKNFGCFDEAALETGLCLKDSCLAVGEPVQITAVSTDEAAGAASLGLLRNLYAAGYDKVVLLPPTGRWNPAATAAVLAEYLAKEKADLILCGAVSGPGDSGAVPFYLGQLLKLPVLTEIRAAFREAGSDRILIRRRAGDFSELRVLNGPAICTVGDAEQAFLRLFSIRARLEAGRKEIIREDGLCTGAESRREEAVILRPIPQEASHCVFPELKTVPEKAAWLQNALREAAR